MLHLRPVLVGITVANIVLAVVAAAPNRLRPGSVRAAAPMLQPRSGHSATLLPDGRVLIAGGMRRNQDFYRSAELYDPKSGKFAQAGDMNLQRVGHAAVLLKSGKVLILGGWIGHDCTDSAELYDPASGKFILTSRMTARRGNPAATMLRNGDVLITGGADHENTPSGTASAELYHPGSSTFEALPAMHYARISHTATLLQDGRVLIAGGRGDAVNSSAELYDPKTKRFIPTGSLITARYKHAAGLLQDGRVLLAGGSDERDWAGALNSAEIYDPRAGRFSAAPLLKNNRFKLPREAVQLASGQILIAGGSKQVEVYDPVSGSFSVAAGELSDAWHFMSETKLSDGTVLLAGGYPNSDRATSETWIFDPR